MTALSLFAWIMLALLLQGAVLFGGGLLRHWQRYRQLEQSAAETSASDVLPAAVATAAPTAAWRGTRQFRVSHKQVESRDGSVCSFHLVPVDGQPLPAFLPGQFLTFELALPGGERLVRCYSLSDAPGADHYRVSIKRVAAGRVSNHFHDRVAVGTVLDARAPGGHFYLDAGEAPVVLIAGGIGITPMLSMLNWCLAQQPGREVWLFYGVRNGDEEAMRTHLDDLAVRHAHFHLRICHSQPLPGAAAGRDYHHAGRIDLDLLRLQLPFKPFHFYICGPGPMMASLVAGLEDWGVPEARIHFETFGPASVPRRQPAALPTAETASDIAITFAKSGKTLPWRETAGSLLEFAEAAGIAVESGCRGGACGACQTTITAGEVAYRQPPDFDPEPGRCLLCVSAPKTSVTLDL